MKIESIKTLIRLGFEPARFFKRSAWVKVERVMDYLVNKGEVMRVSGEVRYATCNGTYNEDDITRWANMFMHSPFIEHAETMRELSKTLRLPLNSAKLLKEFMNLYNTK